jgi:hypothetical protein
MYVQVEKSNKNRFLKNRQESRAVANSVTQTESYMKRGFGFMDNRRAINEGHQQIKPKESTMIIQKLTDNGISKISKNRLYRTENNNGNYVGVKPEAAKPVPSDWITSTGKKPYGYPAYTFSHDGFINDCGKFARILVQNVAGQPLDQLLYAQIDGKKSTVKFSIKSNTSWNGFTSGDLANNAGFIKNEKANPKIGEAYTTIPKSDFKGRTCSFHVAAVVAKDVDNITCEADAGDVKRKEPIFDMYETDVNSNVTFHATYQDNYGKELAATGILVP